MSQVCWARGWIRAQDLLAALPHSPTLSRVGKVSTDRHGDCGERASFIATQTPGRQSLRFFCTGLQSVALIGGRKLFEIRL